ncbi:Piso0_001266 [Millerozyma farinosa CBS 7064]|uniref:Piso0_001266 protein n=1 Tax=Pichia sorbitophila (strain ATCC MYA-4447 / BCRC 22081 / CBS 7064 / NBRC 10061 / NRRL Y-12695) TaxID=559304 RepID=G8YDW7_PICSO|nr:Piso0_001266 [Millerozyma farinosa CBS 7064]
MLRSSVLKLATVFVGGLLFYTLFTLSKQRDIYVHQGNAGMQNLRPAETGPNEKVVAAVDASHSNGKAAPSIKAGSPQSSHSGQSAADVKPSKEKATFVTLARNSELHELIKSIRRVEEKFNKKFHYDWVFFNDEPFSQEFKDLTTSVISGKTKYAQIPKEHWSYPEWLDLEKAAQSRKDLKEQGVIYGDLESYRHMCRFESGFFWQNPILDEYEWYWRVEPNTDIHCDIDYDVFKFMKDNNKKYGFAISLHEFEKTIPSLWSHVKKFMENHPEHIAKDNFMEFLSNDNGKTYNLCHFWSNFEVASLDFWRSKAYRDFFSYLDGTGNFFYERWGDAPVHSIAASLFLPKDQIHYFYDIGYNHGVYTQCPLEEAFRQAHNCDCQPDQDFTFRGYSCGTHYYDTMKLPKPANWKEYTAG